MSMIQQTQCYHVSLMIAEGSMFFLSGMRSTAISIALVPYARMLRSVADVGQIVSSLIQCHLTEAFLNGGLLPTRRTISPTCPLSTSRSPLPLRKVTHPSLAISYLTLQRTSHRYSACKWSSLRMATVVQDGDVVGGDLACAIQRICAYGQNSSIQGHIGRWLRAASLISVESEGPLLEFEVGSGRVIAGFDEAVRGLSVGEKRKVRCEPKDAYGEYDEKNLAKARGIDRTGSLLTYLLVQVPKEQMPTPPEGNDIEPGLILQLANGQLAVVKEVTDEVVVLDGNHPLAGKSLNFEVELFEIKDREEVLNGKIREMYAILNNEVFSNLAAQVTQNPNYANDIKSRIEDSKDKGVTMNEILQEEAWLRVTSALMSNVDLQRQIDQQRMKAELVKLILNCLYQTPYEYEAGEQSFCNTLVYASSKIPSRLNSSTTT
eukprot:756552-Hanusia_phi.AAC.2